MVGERSSRDARSFFTISSETSDKNCRNFLEGAPIELTKERTEPRHDKLSLFGKGGQDWEKGVKMRRMGHTIWAERCAFGRERLSGWRVWHSICNRSDANKNKNKNKTNWLWKQEYWFYWAWLRACSHARTAVRFATQKVLTATRQRVRWHWRRTMRVRRKATRW